MKRFAVSLNGRDLKFMVRYLSSWFGGCTRISEASPEELKRAVFLVLRRSPNAE